MALERIDPFNQEDRFCLDHLLRYEWVRPLVDEMRVLDVACGLGFGTTLLAHANASAVVGVDLDADCIGQCRDWWTHLRVEFKEGRIEELGSLELDPFNRVVCFETLEHVEDPLKALQSIRSVMQTDGLLIGSVPGETDWAEVNEYHLQFFNPARLEALLGKVFRNIKLFRQRYHLGSLIEELEDKGGEVMRKETFSGPRIDFGRSPGWADTYVFMASNGPLPDVDPVQLGLSRQAWLYYAEGADNANREIQRVHDRYRKLFSQHGDLKRRFTNVLGWGKYFHEKATGKIPEQEFLETIENAKGKREGDLKAELDALQRENDKLKKQLQQSAGDGRSDNESKRTAFLESLNPSGSEPK